MDKKIRIALLILVIALFYLFWFFTHINTAKPEVTNPINIKSAPTPISNNNNITQSIQTYLDNHMINGVILVALKDKILINQAKGIKNKEKHLDNDTNTQFLIGSISKLFTATAILKLVEAGKIDLKSKISDYLKPDNAIWDNNFQSFAQDVTIEQLLTHSSGIEDYSKQPGFTKFNFKVHSSNEVIQFFSEYPLKFLPGSQYSYSGSGYTILGAIIEEVSGKKYADFLNTEIFQPLKLNSTFVAPMDFLSLSQEKYPNFATGYMEEGRNKILAEVEDVNLSSYFADASIISTTNDLYTFVSSLFNNNVVLKQEQLKQMTTPYFETNTPGVFTGYGLFITTEKNRPAIIVSTGSIGGYEAILSYEPKNKIAVIILSNVMNDKTTQVAKDLMNLLQNHTTKK